MTIEEVRQAVGGVKEVGERRDSLALDQAYIRLYLDVLQAIADGDPHPRRLAREALKA
jgi:hypothetical protein